MWTVIAAFMLSPQDTPAPVIPPPAASPAMATAQANLARVRTKAVRKPGPHREIPEALKAKGEHGWVHVRAIVGIDGRVSEPYIPIGSGSPAIDALAIEGAMRESFTPARDAKGAPLAVATDIPMLFDNWHPTAEGPGILRYRCDQFVRDEDWWRKTWPGEPDTIFILGSGAARLHQPGGPGGSQARANAAAFAKRYAAAVEACRAAPEALAIDMMGEEGKTLRRLAEEAR